MGNSYKAGRKTGKRGAFEMKVIRYIAAVSLFALLASCQMNTAGDGNQNENPSSESTTEYTVYLFTTINCCFYNNINRK